MATIQIRDIPQDDYDVIVERARAGGQSIQQYMRQLVGEHAARRRKADVLRAIEENLRQHPTDITPAEVLEALDAGRR